MNILIVANHYPVCSARYATAAFERLGHTVKHIGPTMGRDIWGLRLPAGYAWEPDFSVDQWKASNQRAAWPDITLIIDSDPALLDDARHYAHHASVWGVDNHVRDYRRPHFDHYFLAHRHVSVMEWIDRTTPMRIGAMNADMTHLPCCYDPTLHTPSPIPYAERQYDIAMIGVMYPQRWDVVNALKAAGLRVIAGMGLVSEKYRDVYHNARISLCLSINGDLPQRVLETARMGCLIVSNECMDYALLKPEGFWLIEDMGNIVDEVKALLDNPDDAQANIAKSMAWAEPHSWDGRAKKVVEWYEEQR